MSLKVKELNGLKYATCHFDMRYRGTADEAATEIMLVLGNRARRIYVLGVPRVEDTMVEAEEPTPPPATEGEAE